MTAPHETSSLIAPHGGALVHRTAAVALADELRADRDSPRLRLAARHLADLLLIANGSYSPLDGFQGRADFESIVARSRLASDLPWPLPVTLPVDEATARRLAPGARLLLEAPDGTLAGALEVSEVYRVDPAASARALFRTDDASHPGVERWLSDGEWRVAGPVSVLPRPLTEFDRHPHTPHQTRALIAAAGWRTVVGFQTRNPIHRAHEFLLKSALELHDGLLVHPLVGETKGDDVPAAVRLRCYEALLEDYFPASRVRLAVLPAAMRFAGPREALFHALIRKNHGCTHFIVGRDHAGVGAWYGTYDAQKAFDAFDPGELGIVPLRFENAYHCHACGALATARTCPHPPERHLSLSGSAVRKLLASGQVPPPEFSRPEVARVLIEAYAQVA